MFLSSGSELFRKKRNQIATKGNYMQIQIQIISKENTKISIKNLTYT